MPRSTIRYYERIGLLEADGRSRGNYRLYDDGAVRRLRFIKSAQSIGFALDDVRSILASADAGGLPCGDVQDLIERRLIDVEEKVRGLRRVRATLKDALNRCRRSPRNGRCRTVDELRANTLGRGR